MAQEIVQKLNWIDIVLIIVILRALFVSLKRGFVNELLQLLAVLAAICVVLHYYPFCSRFLENRVFVKAEIARSVTFLSLWVLVALVCKFVRSGIHLLLKIDAKSAIDKIGGLGVGLVRGVLVSSLLLSFFATTGLEYLSRHIQGSYLSPHVAPLAPGFYRVVFNEVVVKYFPDEKMNQDLLGSRKEPGPQARKDK